MTRAKRILTVLMMIILISVVASPFAMAENTYIWPTTSHMMSRGFADEHLGLDVVLMRGSYVKASAGGRVETLYIGCKNMNGASSIELTCAEKGICSPSSGGYNRSGACNDGFGNGVIIKHSDGTYTCYAHMDEMSSKLKEGGTVSQGQYLGKSGSTGDSAGPHLHFEIRTAADGGFWKATAIDPLPLLNQKGGLPFPVINDYCLTEFEDIKAEAWYYESVKAAFGFDLMNGTSKNKFTPSNNITRGEAIALAARIHSIYLTGEANFTQGTPWYQVYVDYALQHSITSSKSILYNAVVTRQEFADILSGALPQEALTVIHENISFTDANEISQECFDSVMTLAKAGIVGGSEDGSFLPDTPITRSEVAAISVRMADLSLRI